MNLLLNHPWVKSWARPAARPVVNPLSEPGIRTTIGLAVALAALWWVAALLIRNSGLFEVWYDQRTNFTQLGRALADPFTVPKMVNPPWTAVIMVPFASMPLEVATLIQAVIYFVALALVITRFGGGRGIVLLTLTSFVAFDSVLELNLEWIICLGLLVPYPLSGFFLLVKPQVALGAWIGFPRQAWLATGLVVVGIGLASIVLWGWWPPHMLATIGTTIAGQPFNIAPAHFIGAPLSLLIGGLLLLCALYRQDIPLGVIGWLFCVPYVSIYSLPLHFGFTLLRFRWLGLILFVATWAIYGGAILIGMAAALYHG